MEFFLNVDNTGIEVKIPRVLIKEFETIQQENNTFDLWFRKDKYKDQPLLLIARWLSHLASFRHRCAHIFLDHPILKEGYTFVQLRSFGKDDSPGCFDLPVGGHAKDISTIEETAREELKSELNLDLQEDIEGFHKIGDYNYCELPKGHDFYNIEHRTVFCGRIKNKAIPKIEFRDGEVAAICILSISELKILLEKFPKRVGSGLIGSFPIYIKHKQL